MRVIEALGQPKQRQTILRLVFVWSRCLFLVRPRFFWSGRRVMFFFLNGRSLLFLIALFLYFGHAVFVFWSGRSFFVDPPRFFFGPAVVSQWPVTGGRWPTTGDRWPVAGGRRSAAGVRCPASGAQRPVTGIR